ncbi:hypothetical protein AX15_007869 [Amanita polypyramis BW_CC]|nr:hypothetical protein AX15_007869 [Amanita polypyramis BW_CC]
MLTIPSGIKDLTGRVTYDAVHYLYTGPLSNVTVGKFNGLKVAVKIPRIEGEDVNTFKRRFLREVYAWTVLQKNRHENILELLGILNLNVPGDRMAFVSRYQENETILRYIKNNPRADRTTLVLGIAKGLQHMHKLNIAHGDLKSSNVLISERGTPLVADFGQSRIIDHEAYFSFTGHKHNAIYLAPEIIEYLSETTIDDIDSLKANTKEGDVYAFSITASEVIKGEGYKELTKYATYGIYKKVVEQNARPPRGGIPEGHYALLQKCWTTDVGKRLEIGSVVEELWLLTQQ